MKPNRSRAVDLPEPAFQGATSLEQALLERRSVREYAPGSLSLAEVGQLLWAAQGVTSPDGGRAAPSAGGLYPLELYLAVGAVEDLPVGVYRYRARRHDLVELRAGDVRPELAAAALGQRWVEEAAITLVVAAVVERTSRIYGERSERYVHMEVGHVGQNVCLQAVSLGLGTVVVAALDDERVERLLELPEGERVLAVVPVGRR